MKWVLFFDGECAFCAKSVNRVFDLDQRGVIDFSPLQGELAATYRLTKYADATEGTMVLMRETDGAIFLRSDAILEIARALGGSYRLAVLLRLLPRLLRDGVYRLIAKNRHRIRGGGECRMPSPEFLARVRP